MPVPGPAWLRRVSLDLTGTVPTPRLSDRLMADPATEGRARIVRDLLADPAFARRWGALMTRPLFSGLRAHERFRERAAVFAAGRIARRQGWDAIVSELLTAGGSLEESPEAAFLMQFADLERGVPDQPLSRAARERPARIVDPQGVGC